MSCNLGLLALYIDLPVYKLDVHCLCIMYDDKVQCTDEEFRVLFGDSDNEEPGFEGFDGTVVTYLLSNYNSNV